MTDMRYCIDDSAMIHDTVYGKEFDGLSVTYCMPGAHISSNAHKRSSNAHMAHKKKRRK